MPRESLTYFRDNDGRIIETFHPHLWNDLTRLSAKEGAAAYREQTRRDLLKIVKPGDVIYCVLRDVSRSGMSRRISFFVVEKGAKGCRNGRPYLRNITSQVSTLTGYGMDDNGGLRVSGCGMDMGFAVVYDLGRNLWPKGTPKPHGTRNGEPDRDGGYALKHEWI